MRRKQQGLAGTACGALPRNSIEALLMNSVIVDGMQHSTPRGVRGQLQELRTPDVGHDVLLFRSREITSSRDVPEERQVIL